MKKGFFAIFAVLAIFAMAFMGCPTDGGDGGGGGGGGDPDLPGTLTISVQNNDAAETGCTLVANYGGTGAVTGVTYQWKKGTANVGTNAATLDTSITGAGAGSYTVTVSKTGYKSKTSNSITVTDPGSPPVGGTVPVLATLDGGSYLLNTTEDVNMRINQLNNPQIATLSYVWWKADSADGAGTAISGNNSRDYTPAVNVVGSTWYWVIVTNTATSESTTSNRARIIIYEPTADTAVEYILAANAAMPLWEFTLPAGADWADYEQFSIEYYISKFSRIAVPQTQVRSRLYGAYIDADFDTPDQGNANGWGSNGTEPNPGAFRIVSWNGTKVARPPAASVNPNNDFILDNAKGTAATFGSLFSANSGVVGGWFTVKYATNAGLAQNFAKVTELDKDTVEVIYVGAGIFGPGGDPGTNNYEFYVKNPTLVNKEDPTLNIIGNPNKTGTTELLFAGNLGSAKGATTRKVLGPTDSYEDVEGAIKVYFDLDGGSGSFPTLDLVEGDTLPPAFFDTEPTRDGFDFSGWFVGDDEVDADYIFTEITTVTAKWLRLSVLPTYRVDLNGQTYKYTADRDNDNGFAIKMSDDFDATLYDQIVVVAKFYAADGTTPVTSVANSSFCLKFYPTVVTQGNASGNLAGTLWNFGTGGVVSGDTITETFTLNASKSAGIKSIGIHSTAGGDWSASPVVEVVSIQFIYGP
jgi:hypothetical protein